MTVSEEYIILTGKPYSYFLEKKGKVQGRLRALTERDIDTLEYLQQINDRHAKMGWRQGWAKPMDIGGSDCSHHSSTLKKLWKRGLVDRSAHGGGRSYRVTDVGRAALAKH